MKNLHFILILIVLLLGLAAFFIFRDSDQNKQNIQMPQKEQTSDTIRYVAVGDSYTIGNGVRENERWSNILVERLKGDGINIELVDNLAVSGYTVQDAIEQELPELERLKPDIVTLLIGANDSFRNEDITVFQKNLQHLLDAIPNYLTKKDNVIILTIPNYSQSVALSSYEPQLKLREQEITKQYNQIIKSESEKRGFLVIDLFDLTTKQTTFDYFVDDGLHPSFKAYQEWTDLIYPQFKATISR